MRTLNYKNEYQKLLSPEIVSWLNYSRETSIVQTFEATV